MFSEKDLDHILQQVGGSWLKLKNKKIFITGGTGFIGKWLVGSLIYANDVYSLDCKITILTRNPDFFIDSYEYISTNSIITFLNDDVRLLKNINSKFDFVIHAATDVTLSNPAIETFDVCTIGTRNVLEFSINSEANNFLFLSSGAVYGKQPPELNSISELYNGIPDRTSSQSSYGLGKIIAEWMVSQYSINFGLNTKIARCFAFVGPYMAMDKHFAIGNFIKDCIIGNSIIINGDGRPVRTYLYSSDLTIWLWRILLEGNKGDIYNVGGNHQISIEELAILTKNLINPCASIILSKDKNNNSLPERYVPDINLAKNKLNLSPLITLEESILKTTEWFIQNK
jgi:nucleoside-diphosphate-sugar epimerase